MRTIRQPASLPIAVALLSVAGCNGVVLPEVVPGVDACSECSMVITDPRQACGYISGREFVAFDSAACLLRAYEPQRKRASAPAEVFFADFLDGGFRRADTVTFLITDRVATVMDSGVLSFADRESAEAMRSHEDELVTDWAGLRLVRGEPDRQFEVTFGPGGMAPEMVQAAVNDLIAWRARSDGLDRDLEIAIEGYPDLGVITVPATGEDVEFRMIARRPGSGFPVVRAGDGDPLGMLKVSGAHTPDEEAM